MVAVTLLSGVPAVMSKTIPPSVPSMSGTVTSVDQHRKCRGRCCAALGVTRCRGQRRCAFKGQRQVAAALGRGGQQAVGVGIHISSAEQEREPVFDAVVVGVVIECRSAGPGDEGIAASVATTI